MKCCYSKEKTCDNLDCISGCFKNIDLEDGIVDCIWVKETATQEQIAGLKKIYPQAKININHKLTTNNLKQD